MIFIDRARLMIKYLLFFVFPGFCHNEDSSYLTSNPGIGWQATVSCALLARLVTTLRGRQAAQSSASMVKQIQDSVNPMIRASVRRKSTKVKDIIKSQVVIQYSSLSFKFF